MSQRPKRETANTKPAQIIIDNIQKRRTSAQVQEDARNAAAAKAAKQAADAELKAEKIARIAAAEDKLRREDEDAKKNAERPDLVVGKKRGSKKSVSTNKGKLPENDPLDNKDIRGTIVQPDLSLVDNTMMKKQKFVNKPKVQVPATEPSDDESDGGNDDEMKKNCTPATKAQLPNTEQLDDDDAAMLSEGLVDLPEDSIVDTESSDGRGLEEFDASDQDDDYVIKVDESESDDHEVVIPKKPAAKKEKPKRGELRQTINNARQVAPASGLVIGAKRKDPADPKSSQPDKRAKKSEPMGLMADWKKKVRQKGSNGSEADLVNTELEPVGGEFHDDEEAVSVTAARTAKGANVTKVKYETPMRLVQTPSIDIEQFRRGRGPKKEKYTVIDLPFPAGPGKAAYHQKWRRQFKHSLYHWAGTVSDPFGTNAIMGPKVREIWNAVYPTLVLENDDPAWDVIRGVAGDALLDWRSSAGKDAIKIVVKTFKENKISDDEVGEVAEYYLKKFRFIYGNPDASNPEEKEPFLGPFMLEMFATVLKKTVASMFGYGHPIGGLAMAAATLERAFELIKQGRVTLDYEDDTDKKKPSLPQFNDKLWGPKVRKWVVSTQKLDVKKH